MYTAYGVGFRPDGTIGAQTPKSQFGGSKMDYAKALAARAGGMQAGMMAVGTERIERDFVVLGGAEGAWGGGIKGDKSMRAMQKGMMAGKKSQAQYGAAPQGCSQDSYRYQSQQRMFLGGKGALYGQRGTFLPADSNLKLKCPSPCVVKCLGGGSSGSCWCAGHPSCEDKDPTIVRSATPSARPTVSIMPRQSATRMRQPVQSTTVARLMRRR